jgi:hypothetical protein
MNLATFVRATSGGAGLIGSTLNPGLGGRKFDARIMGDNAPQNTIRRDRHHGRAQRRGVQA